MTPAPGEKNRRPAANRPKAATRLMAPITVLPARAPYHQSPRRLIAKRLSISVPRGMLA